MQGRAITAHPISSSSTACSFSIPNRSINWTLICRYQPRNPPLPHLPCNFLRLFTVGCFLPRLGCISFVVEDCHNCHHQISLQKSPRRTRYANLSLCFHFSFISFYFLRLGFAGFWFREDLFIKVSNAYFLSNGSDEYQNVWSTFFFFSFSFLAKRTCGPLSFSFLFLF